MDRLAHSFDSVDKATFRNGMSRLGSSVNVVTTVSGGERFGFTASAVCSVSDAPATLLVCINRSISCYPAFEKVRHFCVNTLRPGQEQIADVFGGRIPTDNRFAVGSWSQGITGSPILLDASVQFECEVDNVVDQATHRVIFGRVVNITEHEAQTTLLYCMRRYLQG
jgi:flavin reductase